MLKEVVEVLVKALVDSPDQVEVFEEARRRGAVIIKVRVAPSDMGRVIGRGGRIAQAIRTVANAAASLQDLRAIVDIES